MHLTIQKLTINYQDRITPALKIDHLDLATGSHLAIMGPSGSGKSTFVNMISGMENHYDGEILWENESLSAMKESERDNWRAKNIGLIMQDFHLYPGMSALENILLPKRFQHWRLPKSLIEYGIFLLEKAGISHHYHKKNVQLLSRGEKQRVAIARALLGSPKVIIADEPTASLDMQNGRLVAELIKDLALEQRASLIVVTHDETLSNRMHRKIMIEQGEIIQDINLSI